jgi:hypothetical protein
MSASNPLPALFRSKFEEVDGEFRQPGHQELLMFDLGFETQILFVQCTQEPGC